LAGCASATSQHINNAANENFCLVTIENALRTSHGLKNRPAERRVDGHPARTAIHFQSRIDFISMVRRGQPRWPSKDQMC
jgi:hypothetical protein